MNPRPTRLADLDSDLATPPVVFVPGIDGTALLFYRQTPLLAAAFDVVAFPLPDDPDATMSDLVADLHRLVGEVSDQGAILIGESFGGALAMSTALAHPSDIAGLVIINSFPWLARRFQIWSAPVMLRTVPWFAMPLVRTFTESRLHSHHTTEGDLAEFHERSRQIGRRGYIRRLELLRHYDIRNQLGSIEPPTLFLAADEDKLVPSVAWASYMADRVPNAELQILRGYGHVCLINHDLDLLDYVGPWWQRAATSTPA